MFLIFIAGTGAGLAASASLSRRVASLEQLERFITYFETQIRYSAAPIRDIIIHAAGGEYSCLSFLPEAAARMKRGQSPGEAWGGAVRDRGEDCGFTAADREMLREFGNGLGSTDISGQLSHCKTFRGLLEDRLQKARSEARTKGRLYVTLGIAGGLGAALLLY